MPIPTIDRKIRDVLPTMTDAERFILEESLRLNGGALMPIKIWKERNIILDGAFRYEYCTANGLRYEVSEVSLPDENAAIIYRLESNLVHRKLSPLRRIELAERYRKTFQKEAKRNQGTRNDLKNKKKNFRKKSGNVKTVALMWISHQTCQKMSIRHSKKRMMRSPSRWKTHVGLSARSAR